MGQFEDWLVVRGVNTHTLDELKCLCLLRIKGDAGVRLEDFSTHGLEYPVVLRLLNMQYISEFPAGTFNLLPFWKANSVAFEPETVAAPVPDKKGDTPYGLYMEWKQQFNIDVPTNNMRIQQMAHAKRMLKARDFEYWKNIITIAIQDPFWKTACRHSISTLEKAAVSLSSGGGDRYANIFKR